jgi:hypothetical protein
LIDADHRREGIRRDIEAVLGHTPAQPLYLLLHDSFNPDCRRGMREANWSANPHVHLVELDFVPGRFVTDEEPDGQREMWCGFALAVLLPEKRSGDVILHENESLAFRSALRHSVHASGRWWNPVYLVRELTYRVIRLLRQRAPDLYKGLRHLIHGVLR